MCVANVNKAPFWKKKEIFFLLSVSSSWGATRYIVQWSSPDAPGGAQHRALGKIRKVGLAG